MLIRSLETCNFRNLLSGKIEFSPGINAFYGENGQGKTNLIEALHLLSCGKSFRTSQNGEMVSYNKAEAAVEAEIETSLTTHNLSVKISGGHKQYFVDGSRQKSILEFYGRMSVICFSPGDLTLVQGEPAGRRRFMDRHTNDLVGGYLADLLDFNRAIKSKNQVLKNGGTFDQVSSWNRIIAERGVRLVSARKEFTQSLETQAAIVYKDIANEDGALTIQLKSDFLVSGSVIDEATAESLLASAYNREIQTGKSMCGPQRDDFLIGFGGRAAAAFASQGQCRSLAISLKLSLVDLIIKKTGESPILLLDDVESELDSFRNERLKGLLFNNDRQVFITGTEAEKMRCMDMKKVRIFTAKNGEFTPIPLLPKRA